MPKPIPPLYFAAPAPALAAPPNAPGEAARRGFSGVAYSGAAVTEWGAPIVIDLASLALPAQCPVLIEHDRKRRVGVATLAVADGALRCDGYLLSNPTARELAADADDGFPWQLSIHAAPRRVEEVSAGSEIAVNGRTFAGPLTVLRDTAIRELSFTPTGADANTSAQVWSANPDHEVTPPMSVPTDAPGPAPEPAPPADLAAQLAAMTARAEAAEAQLAASARARRLAAVQATLGPQVSEADAQAYLAMDEATWERVAHDLAKPRAPAHLFSEQATGEPAPPKGAELNLSAIYKARQAGAGV